MGETSDVIEQRVRELLTDIGFEHVRSVLGISRATYYNWRSARSAPSVYQVLQLLDSKNLPVSWLVETQREDARLAARVRDALGEDTPSGRGEKCVELPPCDLRDDPIFAAALSWYEETGGFFGDGGRLLDHISAFSLIQGKRQDGIFDYQHFGAGSMAAAYYGTEYAAQPNNCLEIADREFEEWATQFYQTVIATRNPICHDISKVVTVRQVTRLIHYRRLVLPGRTRDSDVVVVIARESAPARILNGLALVG